MSSAADIRVSFPRGECQFVGLQAYLHAASQAVEHLLSLAPSFRGVGIGRFRFSKWHLLNCRQLTLRFSK